MFVTVIEDDGSTLAAALTASGLALADASIQMFDTLVGASIKRVKNRVFIDPDKNEEEMYDGEILGYARFLKMCSEKKRLTPDEHGGWFAAPGWHIVPVE